MWGPEERDELLKSVNGLEVSIGLTVIEMGILNEDGWEVVVSDWDA